MATGTLYKLVFSGETVPGARRPGVRKKLARLLDLDRKTAREYFSGQDIVVREDLDFEAAMAYGLLFEQAGALFRIEGYPSEMEGDGTGPETEAAGSAKKQARLTLLEDPCLVALLPGPVDPLFSPSTAPKVSARPGGFQLARPDFSEVDFKDLEALCLHADPGEDGPQFTLLLFVHGSRRAFSVKPESIQFQEFPEVRSSDPDIALANFITYLANSRPGLVMDRTTLAFLEEGVFLPRQEDIFHVCSAMGKILGSDQEKKKAVQALSAPRKAPPPRPLGAALEDGSQSPDPVSIWPEERPPASILMRLTAGGQSLLFILCLAIPLWIPLDMYCQKQYGMDPVSAHLAGALAWSTPEKAVLFLALLPVLAVLVFSPQGSGRTWGQALLGIRVVRKKTGEPALGPGIWLLRLAGGILQLCSLGLIALVFRFKLDRISIADMVSGTRQENTGKRPHGLWQVAPFALFFLSFNLSIGFGALQEMVSGPWWAWIKAVAFWVLLFFLYRLVRKAKPRPGGS